MKVPRFDLHLAHRPRQAAPMASLLLAIASLVAVIEYLDVLRDRGQALDAHETAIRRSEDARRSIGIAHRSAADPRARELMARQRYAMEPARDLLERGWHPGIALLLLDLATDTRQIDMVFESRSAQEALAFVDWLEMQAATERVLVKRQTGKPGPQESPVETRLQVIWRPLPGSHVQGDGPAASTAAVPPSSVQR
ncbi:hypothetical protein MNR01_02825 [Lysobacter sp. S4-A87]|uniref:hypothetical protein n=1 Tax=Lysobacter sp. S4-A87 TaxID=2925843 RepID=UPI001F531896|nr:hypothetical protein [Lysobacter sp. S4-A87]UNK49992.1 hypothetical protein MNR01_02825 [Lysobacter sp. S4-A87]